MFQSYEDNYCYRGYADQYDSEIDRCSGYEDHYDSEIDRSGTEVIIQKRKVQMLRIPVRLRNRHVQTVLVKIKRCSGYADQYDSGIDG